jgi:hypothetical protein
MFTPSLPRLSNLVQKPGRSERRAARRVTPAQVVPCLLQPEGKAEGIAGWVHNLSSRGVGVMTEKNLGTGALLTILLVNASHTYAVSLQGQVVRSFRVISGDYFLGCEFNRGLTHEELMPFIV